MSQSRQVVSNPPASSHGFDGVLQPVTATFLFKLASGKLIDVTEPAAEPSRSE